MSLLNRWVIPGLTAVGLVAAISLISETGKIEKDLTTRSQALLDEKGMDWASIVFSGRDGVLQGTAPETGMSQSTIDQLQELWGVRVVTDETELLPEQKPFTWGLERRAGALSMFGYLPYDLVETTPTRLADATGGLEVATNAEAARGAPADIARAVDLSGQMLKLLPDGKAMLVDDRLTIDGNLEDGNREHYNAFADLQDLAGNAGLDGITLDFGVRKPLPPTEAPYSWALTRKDKALGMFGYLPEAALETMPAKVAGIIKEADLTLQIEAARGEPKGLWEVIDISARLLAKLPDAKADLLGRKLTISGYLEDGNRDHMALFDTISAQVAGIAIDGIEFDFQIERPLPPVVSPFTWGLSREGNTLAMSGFLTEPLLQQVPEKAAGLLKDGDFASSVLVARGAPDGLLAATDFSASILKQLPAGKAMLSDKILTISGALEDGNDDHVALYQKLKKQIARAKLGDVSLDWQIVEPKKPMPKVNGFTIRRTEAGVDLTGAVPSEKVRKSLLELARRKFGIAGVTSDLEVWTRGGIAGLRNRDYTRLTQTALQAVSRLGSGEATLGEAGLSLKGGAYYDGALEQVQQLLAKNMPRGMELQSELAVAEPGEAVDADRCQVLLKTALEQNTILFDSGRASISSDSFGLLDGLIYTARRCPDSRLQIEGHTDDVGDDATNQLLSERRAASVLGYLVGAGLAEERLEAIGYGETRPVADNATREGKAKNRRIEFLILAQ